MKQEQFEQLVRILNTLNTITTKGEDTIIMGTCLQALKVLIQQIEQDNSLGE